MGKPFKRFDDIRSREILANWLIRVVKYSVDAGEQYRGHCR
jgi:hypothetical protein